MYGPSINVLYVFLVAAGAILIVSLNISCLLTLPRKCGSGLSASQIEFIQKTNATRVHELEQLATTHTRTLHHMEKLEKKLLACHAIQNMSQIELNTMKQRLQETHACPAPPAYSQKLLQSIRDQTITQAMNADWYGHEQDYLHQLMLQDHYRHNSIMSVIRPILTAYPASSWVTVADSIWGMNAGYIKKFIHAHGGTVTATALTNVTIAHAAVANLIDAYSVEDAEQLSFRDHQFDFGFVKDGLQAMSRPSLAIYELLRVSRTGVILIEPHDKPAPPPTAPPTLGPWAAAVEIPVDPLANLTQAILLNRYDALADTSYKLSARECVKIAKSMNFPIVMLKGLMDPEGTKTKDQYEQLKSAEHAVVDNGLDAQQQWYDKMVCVFFKIIPEQAMIEEMRRENYLVLTLEQKSFV